MQTEHRTILVGQTIRPAKKSPGPRSNEAADAVPEEQDALEEPLNTLLVDCTATRGFVGCPFFPKASLEMLTYVWIRGYETDVQVRGTVPR
jgi:hypothetical protein